ncbi:MAG: Txe/YoeB family addiction module toxin [Bacteroidales bacterium]|nr:Txe/YoeB family addiction module toxin [Bacteroidales bacterium]
MYRLKFSKRADLDLALLRRNEPKAFEKAEKLLEELQEHPTKGTGHPEQLRGNRANQWSRRITSKHCLVYEIEDFEIVVIVISAYGHYGDK